MDLSLWPSTSRPWDDLLEAVRHADATGWHGVYVADHFMGDGAGFGPATAPWLEATAVVAALAGSTERVRLAPLVLSATYRHPAVVANWAATVDRASGGRFTITGKPTLPMLALTTTGRRSGQPRTVQLAYHRVDDDLYVVASAMGQEHHPAWRHNLEADPHAHVLLRGDEYDVTATLLSDEEKAAVWPAIKRTARGSGRSPPTL